MNNNDQDKKLPKGFNNYDWEQVWIDDFKPQEPIKLKCTCGTSITMGKDDHIDFHSPKCDLKAIKTK